MLRTSRPFTNHTWTPLSSAFQSRSCTSAARRGFLPRRVVVLSLRHQLTLHHRVMQEEPLLVGHRFLIEPHLVLRDRATAIVVAEVAEFLIDVLPHVRSIHEPH